jgi:formamidase
MPQVVFSVDQSKSMRDQVVPGHNRWHPDIPVAAMVRPGDEFRVECREWTDAQLGNNDSANDVRDVELSHAHMLSGPIGVEGAEPGDLLVVDILDLGPVPQTTPAAPPGDAPGEGWGYTGIFAKANGGGFLTDYFPNAYKAIWDFHGQVATSRHLPGIRYTGITHPGLFGTAPSAELLARWNRREQALIDTDPNRVPPLGLPPLEQNTLAGQANGGDTRRIAMEGARTVPARENGGNHDIKNFTRGSRVFYPVHVRDAKLSGGDLHFSQGDGEITFCGAIEMGGFIDFHVDLIKDGMNKYGVTTNPIFMPGNVEPRYSEFLTFIGVSVDHDTDTNYYLDATVAYRRACLNAIEYLKKFGYTGEQAYLLLGSAPIEGRVSGVVDIPNACCSLYLPTAIFDFDVRPTAEGPTRADRGQCAMTS